MSQRVVKSLNFGDADLGSLYDLEDVSADGALWLRATGLVEVPESARLLLSNHGGSSNLSALARFLPDDLWEIDLMYSDVRDEDLEHIAHLTGLRRLDLSMTRTTDAAIPYLEGLHGLEWLGLFNTKISRAGVGRLRQALPSCVLGGLPSVHLVRIPAGQERSQPGRFKKHNDRLHGRDRAKLQRIREGGAALSHPLEITHRLTFEIEDGRGQADTAAARLRNHGYTVSVEYSRRYAPVSPSSRGPSQAGASSRKGDPGVWEVTASRVAVLAPPEINATVAEVSGVAEEFGGLYWRWGAHPPAT